jgi:hypothetical protein
VSTGRTLLAQTEHRALDLRGGSPFAAQGLHRPTGRRRLRRRIVNIDVAIRPRPTHAMHLLGGIDQQEKEREGTCGDRAQLERQCFHLGKQRFQRGRTGFSSATVSRCHAQRLDRLEGRFALDALNDAAERGSEPAHVVVQRLIDRANGGLGWRRWLQESSSSRRR